MGRSLTLGRIWDIPIRVHWSFLLILPVFAFLMGRAYFAGTGPADLIDYVWGGALAVALFASVVAHELGHSWTAGRYGVPIHAITLLPIGGVAQMERMPDDPRQEMRVALAGPVVSLGIGLPIVAIHEIGLVPSLVPHFVTFVFWLGYLNVFLGAFNLFVPAFPMDGGRVLRAGLAQRMGTRRATEIASSIGRGLAVAMGLLGLFTFSGGGWLLVLVAAFIYLGATQEENQVRARVMLGDVTVGEAMTRDVRSVTPDTTIEEVYGAMRETKHLSFPVVEGDRVVGVVGLEDLAEVDPAERPGASVRDLMRTDVDRFDPSTPVRDLLPRLGRSGEDRIVVVEGEGRLLGVVTRTDLVRLIRILHAEEGSEGPPAAPPQSG